MSTTQSIPQASADPMAAALREIADRLTGLELAVPSGAVTIMIQPRDSDVADADKVRFVDAIAKALFGSSGAPHEMGSGRWHHDAHGYVGPVSLAVLCGITSPSEREQAAELERLQAELAEREAELDNLRARAAAPQAALASAILAPDAVPGGAS